MSLILSLETSAKVCSVALHDKGILLSSSEVHIEQSHASKLSVLIDEVQKFSGINLNQLKGVAITSGPGSYTGLRIGASTAKGLCYALNIPLITVGSLDLLAFQVQKQNFLYSYLCPMIDARRMEVYCMVVDPQLKPVEEVNAKVIDQLSFAEYLDRGKVIFFGDGSDKCRDTIDHDNAVFIGGVYPAASHLGVLAYNKLVKGVTEELHSFEPHYLKEFVVKRPKSSSA